jgi:hypothetical protein
MTDRFSAASNSAKNAAQAIQYTAEYFDHSVADKKSIWHMCPEIIRKVASIGDTRPVECVISADQLADALEV